MSEDRKQNLSVSAFKQNVNPDDIYNKNSSTFDKSSVYGRYGFGKATDDVSFINASLPSKIRDWLDKQQLEGPITRQEFLDAARAEGGVAGEAEARLLLAVAEQRWASFTLGQSASFQDALENVSNVVNQSYKPQLEIAKAYLQEYKKFLQAIQNPTLVVVKEIIKAVRNFFNDLFNTGLYWYIKTSSDIGEEEKINYSLNNDYTGLYNSKFIRNSVTNELEYIDYVYETDAQGFVIRDTSSGSPIPKLDNNNKKIIIGEGNDAWIIPSVTKTPWKVARFTKFIEQLEADLKYSIDERGVKSPKNTPAFTSDAQSAALVLFVGAQGLFDSIKIFTNLINVLNDVITTPFKEMLKSFYPFFDQFRRSPTILNPVENKIYIFTFTNVKNPKGDPNNNYSKFIAGRKPIVKWDSAARNPSNPKSATGFIKKTIDNNPYRTEVNDLTGDDDETVSFSWIQKQSEAQGQSTTPERVFIKDDNSGMVFEVIYVFEEKLVEPTNTNVQTDDNGEEYFNPFQLDGNIQPYYDQKLICIQVDRDLSKKDLQKGSLFYEVQPVSSNKAKTTDGDGNEEDVDPDLELNWNWKIKNGKSLLETLSEKEKVQNNIKFYQLQYLYDAFNNYEISAPEGSQTRAIINSMEYLNDEEHTVDIAGVNDSENVNTIQLNENGLSTSSDNNQNRTFKLGDRVKNISKEITDQLEQEYKKRVIDRLWDGFTGIESPFGEAEYILLPNSKKPVTGTNIIDDFRTRSKNPDDIMFKIKNKYNPILRTLVEYLKDDNIEPEELKFLRRRDFWTWSEKDQKFPGPVYGTLVQEESVLFSGQVDDIEPGPWASITVGQFFNADEVLRDINDFFDRLEKNLEPFETLIENLITGIENTIKTIEALIAGLNALLDFLKALGDTGLYVLLIENDFGGTNRILEQIKSAPNGPPNTLKHGALMILLAGWAGGTSSTGEQSNLEKTWQAFLEFIPDDYKKQIKEKVESIE